MTPLSPGEWAWPPAPGTSLSRGTDKSVGQQVAAPAVQVTIGRVEVRASTPAAPERKPARQPTVMSLDEYLKRAR
jgi:hypothetical protein